MKTYKFLFIVLSSLFFMNYAHADIIGRWSGWGTWNYQGRGTNCFDVRFSFDETAQQFIRVSGRLECYFVNMEHDPITFQKDGHNLLSEGKIVGTYDINNYEWIEQYSESVQIKVSIHRDGLHINYLEQWVLNDGSSLYEIHARLFKGTQ